MCRIYRPRDTFVFVINGVWHLAAIKSHKRGTLLARVEERERERAPLKKGDRYLIDLANREKNKFHRGELLTKGKMFANALVART